MATPTGGDDGLPNEVCDINYELRCQSRSQGHSSYDERPWERGCCGNAFIRKKKVLSADFKESEDAEISKETVKLFTGNLMGRNNRFLSLICR